MLKQWYYSIINYESHLTLDLKLHQGLDILRVGTLQIIVYATIQRQVVFIIDYYVKYIDLPINWHLVLLTFPLKYNIYSWTDLIKSITTNLLHHNKNNNTKNLS